MGNRNRDLSACSAVAGPTVPSRNPCCHNTVPYFYVEWRCEDWYIRTSVRLTSLKMTTWNTSETAALIWHVPRRYMLEECSLLWHNSENLKCASVGYIPLKFHVLLFTPEIHNVASEHKLFCFTESLVLRPSVEYSECLKNISDIQDSLWGH